MRATTLLALLVLASSAPASAQDDAITTTALMIPEGGAENADLSIVNIGVRRGIHEVDGVRFVHPVDVIGEQYDEEVAMWIDQLDAVADMVRTGDPQAAYERADEAIGIFENNLRFVRRTQLVDAYMLAAVARCRAGLTRDCRGRIRDIIAFREGHEYDAARYGSETQDVYDQERNRALGGPRGALVIETQPAGAEVYIDGRSYGPSPVTAVGLLAGDHYVTVKELGYEELIARATVHANRESTESYPLTEDPQARRVLNLREPIRGELGGETAGPSIRSLASSTGTTQTIIGVVRPAAGEQIHVHLFLYHVHTRLLQNDVEGTLTRDEAGMDAARRLTVSLYEGVDLEGGIDAPDDPDLPGRQPELYEQWWFWATIGGGLAVIAGAIIVGVAVSEQEQVPGGFIRIQGTLP